MAGLEDFFFLPPGLEDFKFRLENGISVSASEIQHADK